MDQTVNQSGYFLSHGNRELFYQSWTIPNPRGIVIITHGLFENSDRYDSLARWLNQDGWNTYGWDLRGHGRSSGIRGFVRNFRLFERDLVHFSHFVLKKYHSLPYVYIGHSLGGLIIAKAMDHEEDIISTSSAVCLITPALGLRFRTSLFKLIVSRVVGAIYPWWTYYDRHVVTQITRDPFFQQKISFDPFIHNKVCPEIYLNIFRYKKTKWSMNAIQPKLLIQMGGDDVAIDGSVIFEYYNSIQSKQTKKMIYYPSGMHKLLEDIDRVDVIKDLKRFLSPLLSKGPTK